MGLPLFFVGKNEGNLILQFLSSLGTRDLEPVDCLIMLILEYTLYRLFEQISY